MLSDKWVTHCAHQVMGRHFADPVESLGDVSSIGVGFFRCCCLTNFGIHNGFLYSCCDDSVGSGNAPRSGHRRVGARSRECPARHAAWQGSGPEVHLAEASPVHNPIGGGLGGRSPWYKGGRSAQTRRGDACDTAPRHAARYRDISTVFVVRGVHSKARCRTRALGCKAGSTLLEQQGRGQARPFSGLRALPQVMSAC
jgi:hypothetical protein